MEPIKIQIEVNLSDRTLAKLAEIFAPVAQPACTEAPAPVPAAPVCAVVTAPAPETPAPVAVPVPDSVHTQETKPATLEDLRAVIRDARARIGAAAPIKEVLKKYGAENAPGVPEDKRADVMQEIKAL